MLSISILLALLEADTDVVFGKTLQPTIIKADSINIILIAINLPPEIQMLGLLGM